MEHRFDLMWAGIQRWLAPPVFPEDQIRTRRAGVLNAAWWAGVVLVLCIVAGNLAGGGVSPVVDAVDLVFVAASLALRRWVKQGRIALAGGGLLAVGFLALTLGVALLGTVRTPAAGVYLILVITAGLLFDWNGMIGMTVLSSLAIGGLILAENSGWLPRPDYAVTVTQWITSTALYAWAGSLTLASLQSTHRALAHANRQMAERTWAESVLRESEEKYHHLFEMESDTLCLIDNVTGEILEANAAATTLYGYSHAELLGMRNTDLSAQPDETRRAMSEQHTLIPVRYHRKKDGTVIAVEIAARHTLWHGRPVHLAAIRDITARLETEAARRESEERFQLAFQHNPAGMALTGIDGRFLQVNPALCDMLGYSEQELLARTLPEVTFREDRAVSAELFHRVLSGEDESAGFEKRYVRQNGTLVWSLVNSSLVRNAQGQPLYFVSQMQNITERKHAEEALRKSEERFRAAQDVSLEAFTILKSLRDDRGRIVDFVWTYANAMAGRLLRLPQEELIGQRLLEVLPGNREDRALFERYVRIADTAVGDEVELEYHADGIAGWFRNAAIKLGDGVAVSFSDITERKKAEMELHAANVRLANQLGELQELEFRLREQAIRDPLTQLYNRRYLNETLPRELAHAVRHEYRVGVLMLDIDHFKRINDSFGHLAGDETLQSIARTLTTHLRAGDIVCRYGGEEFLCLLLNTTPESAQQRAEQICAAIAGLPLIAAEPAARVTVSVGVALSSPAGGDMTTLLNAADEALYAAKADGRNRVRVAHGPGESRRGHGEDPQRPERVPGDPR